jgi:uncharacterized protein (TIGR02246 family)
VSQASVLLVVSLSFRAVAAPAGQECGQDAAGVREIRAVATGIIAADNERATERVLAYYTPDAIWMPPEQDAVVGREQIRARYEALFAAFTPEISPTIEQACVAESLGFVRGHHSGRVVNRTSWAARDLDGAYLMLLRREADGAWRISHLMWHRRSRASAPAGH